VSRRYAAPSPLTCRIGERQPVLPSLREASCTNVIREGAPLKWLTAETSLISAGAVAVFLAQQQRRTKLNALEDTMNA
jgi:hypothetical protein